MNLRYRVGVCCAAAAGAAIAVIATVALAKSFTLEVAKNVPVKGKKESVVANSGGVTLYYLAGETTSKLICNSTACLRFWPPDKVTAHGALTAAPGVKGKLRRVHRGSFYQVTLNGHPLYRFKPDNNKPGMATGEGIVFPGGHVWHVIAVASGRKSTHTGTTTTTTSSSTTTTSTSSSCLYPPYCY